jgi:hypothetical protein
VSDRYPGRHRNQPRTERLLAIAGAVLVVAVVGATTTWAAIAGAPFRALW